MFEMMTGSVNVTIIIKYEVVYLLSIRIFTFVLGSCIVKVLRMPSNGDKWVNNKAVCILSTDLFTFVLRSL